MSKSVPTRPAGAAVDDDSFGLVDPLDPAELAVLAELASWSDPPDPGPNPDPGNANANASANANANANANASASLDMVDGLEVDGVLYRELFGPPVFEQRLTRLEGARAIAATAAADEVEQLNDSRLECEALVQVDIAQGLPPSACESNQELLRRALVAELAVVMLITEREAQSRLEEAQLLVEVFGATLQAMREGWVPYRNARILVDQGSTLPTEVQAVFEQKVLPWAARMNPTELRRKARALREKLHPVSISERHSKAVTGRYLDFTPAADGMMFLTAHLSAVDAVAIYNRCTSVALSLQNAGNERGDDKRGVGQLRVDAFRDLLIDGTIPANSPARATAEAEGRVLAGAAATGIRATVMIVVPALTLLGRDTEPALLEGYGPIDLETAKVLAAGASSWVRVLTHPETGAVLSVGRKRYKVPAEMRLFLRFRDQVCRFPGCSRLAKNCQLDHTDEWQYGGATAADNLSNLCPPHHAIKGGVGWKLRQLGNGILEWVAPSGRVTITEPAVMITTAVVEPAVSRQWFDPWAPNAVDIPMDPPPNAKDCPF